MNDGQIFQLLGLMYLALGLGLFIDTSFYNRMFEKLIEDLPALYLGGVLALAIGFLLVSFHNKWELDWPVIITIIGWTALIKGLFILVLPRKFQLLTQSLLKRGFYSRPMSVAIILAGTLLMFLGFSI